MDSKDTIIQKLLEIFPHLTKEQAKSLAASNDSFSVLVTRVLDNNIERPYTDLKDLTKSTRSTQSIQKEYNYPEIFCRMFEDIHASVGSFRKRATDLYEQAQMIQCATRYKFRSAHTYYSIEADDIRAMAEDYNRRAAMLIMRQALEQNKTVDLHGLYVNEALLFLDDLYLFYNFNHITLITGRKYNSLKLRPAVEKWLRKNDFIVSDEGPSLYATKKSHIY